MTYHYASGRLLPKFLLKIQKIRYAVLALGLFFCMVCLSGALGQTAGPAFQVSGERVSRVAIDTNKTVRDTLAIEEVEINTGYQRLPKERATGSFVFLDSAVLQRSVSTDIISRLKGVTPSLLFDERAGGAPKLSIRGISTIYGNAAPLIVVDNFPYEGDLANINPNDVENISILRDAAAASIWGIRAGNGVIVITTKKGRQGDRTQIGFNGNATLTGKPDLWYTPRIASADYIEAERFLYRQGFYTNDLANDISFPVISPAVEILADATLPDTEKDRLLTMLGSQDIRDDIDRHFHRSALNQQYTLNLQGGGERHGYYYAAGMDRNRQQVITDAYSRVNVTARHRFRFFDRLDLQTALEWTGSRADRGNTLPWLQNAYPYERLADDDGNHLPIARDFRSSFAGSAARNGRLDWRYIPLDEAAHNDIDDRLGHLRASAQATYTLFAGLQATVAYQYEQQASTQQYLQREGAYYTRDLINRFLAINDWGSNYPVPLGGILDRADGRMESHNGRVQLGYANDWRDGAHTLNLLAGAEVREVMSRTYASRYYGYDELTGTSLPVNTVDWLQQYPTGNWSTVPAQQGVQGTLNRFRSYYANGAYSYHTRYTLSASARIDQTNLFGVKANQRSIPLWSMGGKWDLHRESFVNVDFLSRLSLRTSYGYNGNFDATATAYMTAMYLTSRFGVREAILGALPNPELRGERAAVWNTGLDFASRNQRIGGQLDFYRRRGKDLIGNRPIDPTTGRNTFRGNLAHMQATGIDVTLHSENIARGAFRWQTDAWLSHTTDRITDYGVDANRIYYFYDASLSGLAHEINPVAGRPIYGVYSYRWAGLDGQTGDPMGYLDGSASNDYAAITGQASIDSLLFHGRALPSTTGSLRNTFTYGPWSLSANITFKLDYYFRRSSTTIDYVSTPGSYHADYALRWQQPGDERKTNVPSVTYPQNGSRSTFYENASVLVERGDHIRLQDVQLSYDLRPRMLRGSSTLQIYAYCNNLGLLWRANKQGLDPDYNSNRRLGNTTLPHPRSYALGVRANIL